MPARVECAGCGQSGQPLPSKDNAAQLARVHDRLIHRGEPTATVATK
jgi:hypothetical protein